MSDPEPMLSIHGVPIYFTEDWRVGIGGGLWSTGLALAKYLQTDHALTNLQFLAGSRGGPGDRKTLSVLELGSGNGFLAVCLRALGRDYIQNLVITDTEDHLDMIRKTVDANRHLPGDDDRESSDDPVMHILPHWWGCFQDTTQHESKDLDEASNMEAAVVQGLPVFDLIVGSDVAYRKELYQPLIASCRRFSHAQTVLLIGVTMVDTTSELFDEFDAAGFVYERIADHLLEPEYRGTTFGIFVIQKKKQQYL